MNKLDEIVENIKTNEFLHTPRIAAKKVALEFAKHILEEAADNAKVCVEDYGIPKWSANFNPETIVDKQSITDTLNKYL